MLKRDLFNRNVEADDLLENFLISAVSSILLIRFYLEITGYPQLNGGAIHVAHMLWGGLLLLCAIVLMLSFLGTRIQQIAAIVGGIGFGTFIDELGKFITNDNNYFFQPTVALLYFLFLILFFTFRFIRQYQLTTEKEYLLNSIRLLGDAVVNDIDAEEKKKLLHYVEKYDGDERLQKHLKALVRTLSVVPIQEPNHLSRVMDKLQNLFEKTIQSTPMKIFVLGFFIIKFALAASAVTLLIVLQLQGVPSTIEFPVGNVYMGIGQGVTTVLSAILIAMGVFTLKFSPKQAYVYFKYSLLVDILLGQFFMFYHEQFSALFGLIFNILLLLHINYLIILENVTKTKQSR